jgi:hypothetical protein
MMNSRDEGVGQHRRAWDAIPWVVNGSASAAEQRWVDEHVRGCADCRTELARQRELQAAVAHEMKPLADVDAGVKRLFKRIDQAGQPAIAASHGRMAPTRSRPMRTLTLWLAAAVIVEAVGISVLGVGLLWRSGPARDYQTLSDSAANQPRATIRIVPAPTMQLGELQQQLQALNLMLVSGPNTLGAYGLAPHGEHPSHDAQLAGLRAIAGMRLVEPIAAEGRSP